MQNGGEPNNFEREILPHLDAAYNLARWLTRNELDAHDAVQEAYLRAFRFFPTFRGGNARAWLLKIVRNECYSWLQLDRPLRKFTEFDEVDVPPDSRALNPESYRTVTSYSKEKRSQSSLLTSARYSFFASLKGCLTERSQILPECQPVQ